ncbi:unnamed protein product, partial [Rangifer tarandus platyrhynchus]
LETLREDDGSLGSINSLRRNGSICCRELAPPSPGSRSKEGRQAACGTAEQAGLFRRSGALRGPASPAGVRGAAGFSEGPPSYLRAEPPRRAQGNTAQGPG